MRCVVKLVLSGVLLILFGCGAPPEAPVAKKVPHELEKFGDVRIDNYYWLNERDNPEVVEYLKAENEYLEKSLKHTKGLQKKLFNEIKNRIKPDDETVPYLADGYYYYERYEKDKEYAVYCRKKELDAPEEIMLDGNELAEGHEFFQVRGLRVSSGRDLLAYAVDTVGRRFYIVHFKNLTTGETLEDEIPDVTGNLAWANDNKTLFYAKQDPETLRWFRIYRHVLGTDPSEDALVYEEEDPEFSCYVYKSKSREMIMLGAEQTLSTEVRYLDANDPTGEFTVILPREEDHEYSVTHYAGRFYIRTNWQAKNFRLMETPVTNTAKENWREVVPHREDVFLSDYDIFEDFLVLTERFDGLNHIRVIPWHGEGDHYLDFGEPAYMAYTSNNMEFDTPVVRYEYTSMTTPNSTYDYNMVTKEKTLLKEQEVLGGFDKSNYVTERLMAEARDGTMVPISIVYGKEFTKDGSHPLVLYGYGSYGISMQATFSPARLSLLDRGFAYAIAHIRGGQEMGRSWYEDGKLLKKKNTFYDFIDCAKYLIDQRYTSSDRLFASGGSAGGLLVGAVVNIAPELFKGAIAWMPFVDVMTTMLDPSIPLTTGEYDEWGNPNEKEYYDYMRSYSPYDNVEAKDYPALFVATGLQDSQVQYWEPAKWVAKLRALKTNDNPLYLYTNMGAGHGGATGRFKQYKETALAYAFLLDQMGIKK